MTLEDQQNSQSKMRKAHQNVLFELLNAVDTVCRRHNIPYMLFAGTALGAVRHSGFIPWDDDLDIVMLRPDFEHFMKVAQEELNSAEYTIQIPFTEHWPMFFSKLRKNNTTCWERYIPKDPQSHQGVYIDIFPCDNLSDNKLLRRLQFAASKVVIAKALDRRGYYTDSKAKKAFMFLCKAIPCKPMVWLVKMGKKGKSRCVHTFLGGASRYEKNIYPREWFEDTVLLPFEQGQFPVSAHYDAMLTTMYGDYMTLPPQDQRGCKVHAEFIDLEHSYEMYLSQQRDGKFKELTRSIR